MQIRFTPTFKRDFKRYKKKHFDMSKLQSVIQLIVNREIEILCMQYKDHILKGQWQGYRELHIESDWLLIYKIDNDNLILTLFRTGSHDDLF